MEKDIIKKVFFCQCGIEISDAHISGSHYLRISLERDLIISHTNCPKIYQCCGSCWFDAKKDKLNKVKYETGYVVMGAIYICNFCSSLSKAIEVHCSSCQVPVGNNRRARALEEILALYRLSEDKKKIEALKIKDVSICNNCNNRENRKKNITIKRDYKGKSKLSYGVEIETLVPHYFKFKDLRTYCNEPALKRVNDTSIHPPLDLEGAEFITPPCDLAKLRNILKPLLHFCQATNVELNNTCSVHVHISVPENYLTIHKLFKYCLLIEPIVYAMLNRDRIKKVYCRPLPRVYNINKFFKNVRVDKQRPETKYLLDQYLYKTQDLYKISADKNDKYCGGNIRRLSARYSGFNFHSIYYRGTFEWRQHQGSLDYDEIIRWVHFINRFMRYILFNKDRNLEKLADIKKLPDKYNYLADVLGLRAGLREYYYKKVQDNHKYIDRQYKTLCAV